MQCPDGFGSTAQNVLTVIYRYGTIWLIWIIVNRFLCEQLQMADSLLNFAQIAGTLGGFDLAWPKSLETFLTLCGILDFDIDVTGPHCIVEWTWISNFYLQLSLPLVVRDSFRPRRRMHSRHSFAREWWGLSALRSPAFGTSGCFREPDRVLNIRSDGMHCSPLTADQ